MPYVPPGSSQACLPRKAVSNTVLEQTRRKAGGKTGVRSYRPSGEQLDQPSVAGPSTMPPVDTEAATALLAERLEVTHIDQPAVPTPQPALPTLAPVGSHSPPSISPTPSDSDAKSQKTTTSGSASDTEDPVTAYKAAIHAYTRSLMESAKNPAKEGKKAAQAYAQFGTKQSGMQKLAAKKALARQLNA